MASCQTSEKPIPSHSIDVILGLRKCSNDYEYISGTEMDFLRRSARCSKLDRVRNEDIRKKLEYQNFIVDYIHNKQLPGYGHVRRMEEGRPAKQILEWIPAGRKRRGRPGTTWIEEIQKALDHRRLTEEECRDRIEWRRKVWAREDA
ncbi:uncharacterized protein LOC111636290 [Centruroides sculpturatus]|uniref:uncharacterized protein LOC111636290 n=1 Tax=Centruroides sculpturatus TaxID=218467 RepID=UPI000C6DDB06|nr:uncharacterized protein LOC111636290 [Centruroides sculpturatus]